MTTKNTFLAGLITVVSLVGIFSGVVLVQRKQLIEQQAAPSTTLSIVPGSSTLSKGASFTLTVNISSGSNAITGSELYIDYNPSVTQVSDIVQGTFFDNPWVQTKKIDSTLGRITFVVMSPPGTSKTGSGVLATITGQTINYGSSTFSFAGNTLLTALNETANVLTSSTPGIITVPSPVTNTPTLAPLPTNTPTPKLTATPTLSPTPAPKASLTISPSSGSFRVGQDFSSSINLNTGGIAISGFAFQLTYPYTSITPAVTVTSVTPTFTDSTYWNCPTHQSSIANGSVVIAVSCTNSSSTGYISAAAEEVINLSLHANSVPTPNPVVLSFSSGTNAVYRKSDGWNILISPTTKGSYSVLALTPTPTLRPTPTNSPTPRPITGIPTPTKIASATPTRTTSPTPVPTPIVLKAIEPNAFNVREGTITGGNLNSILAIDNNPLTIASYRSSQWYTFLYDSLRGKGNRVSIQVTGMTQPTSLVNSLAVSVTASATKTVKMDIAMYDYVNKRYTKLKTVYLNLTSTTNKALVSYKKANYISPAGQVDVSLFVYTNGKFDFNLDSVNWSMY